MTVVITREFGFDMGHMLPDHRGACHRPHGHRYRGEVQVSGELKRDGSARGMIVDFGTLKTAIEETVMVNYDHRFAVCTDDPRFEALQTVFSFGDLVIVSQPPTAENLARWIGGALSDRLADIADVRMVRLWETPTCSAAWWAS